jgi:nucleoside 2-deoxyribosyltransferase
MNTPDQLPDRPPRVYLAGPSVFFPDAVEVTARRRELCLAAGLEPVIPGDNEKPAGPDGGISGHALAEKIYRSNIDRIDRADLVIAELTPFRGAEPDSGTCFEVGYAVAHGLPCYLFGIGGGSAIDRVRDHYGPVNRRDDGNPVDRDGRTIENFDYPVNLMLSAPGVLVDGTFEDAVRKAAADHLHPS